MASPFGTVLLRVTDWFSPDLDLAPFFWERVDAVPWFNPTLDTAEEPEHV